MDKAKTFKNLITKKIENTYLACGKLMFKSFFWLIPDYL